jgi:K+-sensing histidine kinase KdpD
VNLLAPARTPFARYLAAVLLVTVAVVLTDALPDAVERRMSAFFFGAVMLSAWWGGFGPGLLATALSATAMAWFFTPPIHTFALSGDDTFRIALFVVMAVFISYLNHARRRAETRHADLLLHEKLGRARSESMEWRYKALASAAGVVARAREVESALDRIAHLAMPRFAAACVVRLRAADGSLAPCVKAGTVDASHAERETAAAARAIESGHPVTEGRLIAVPLIAGGQTRGTMSFLAAGEHQYREEDLAFAQDLAQHAALVVSRML